MYWLPWSWRMPRPAAASFSTPPKCSVDALADRLQRLVAGAVEGGVDADAFRRAVIDGDEDGDLAVLDGEGRGHVGSPHGVDGLRDDRAVVVARAAGAAGAGRRRRPFSRISRRTRSFEVRRPGWRSRAQTLR